MSVLFLPHCCRLNGDFTNTGAANTRPYTAMLGGVPAVVFNVTVDGMSDR